VVHQDSQTLCEQNPITDRPESACYICALAV
jgi:hypothetical protein